MRPIEDVVAFIQAHIAEIIAGMNHIDNIQPYIELQAMYNDGPIEDNDAFRRLFIKYYKLNVSRPTPQFIEAYFQKLDGLHGMAYYDGRLAEILHEFAQLPRNRVEFSFATKLIHTRFNDKPIFDSFVKKLWNLPVIIGNRNVRIELCNVQYQQLQNVTSEILNNGYLAAELAIFDQNFDVNDVISPVKKLDFLYWRAGNLWNELH